MNRIDLHLANMTRRCVGPNVLRYTNDNPEDVGPILRGDGQVLQYGHYKVSAVLYDTFLDEFTFLDLNGDPLYVCTTDDDVVDVVANFANYGTCEEIES